VTRLLFLAPLLSLLLSPLSPAAAATIVPASGSFTQTSFVPTVVRQADGVTIIEITEADALTGTFSGTLVVQATCVVRASGQGVCQGRETFTGTVTGRAGTVESRVVIRLDGPSVQGQFFVVEATGDLAGLHGQGTFQGTGTTGTYTGQLIILP
jgi:Protein of unknown function (DUF3224)